MPTALKFSQFIHPFNKIKSVHLILFITVPNILRQTVRIKPELSNKVNTEAGKNTKLSPIPFLYLVTKLIESIARPYITVNTSCKWQYYERAKTPSLKPMAHYKSIVRVFFDQITKFRISKTTAQTFKEFDLFVTTKW